jgi:hypothetical protein
MMPLQISGQWASLVREAITMARVRQIHRRYRSAGFGRRGTPLATPPALPLADALTLAAQALRKIERGDGERTLAADILEAHRDGKPLP